MNNVDAPPEQNLTKKERVPQKQRSRRNVIVTNRRKMAEKDAQLAEKEVVLKEERKKREDAEINSVIDPLTGLKNRKWFQEQLEVRIANAERHSKQVFWLAFMDFDDFKQFNDVDHAVGDKVLKVVGSVATRPGEDIARWGGDEFTQLVNSGINEEDAIRVAARNANEINTLSKGALSLDSDAINSGVSQATISLALLKYVPGMNAEQLIKAADVLLKKSKKTETKDKIFVSTDGGMTAKEVSRTEVKQ